MGKIVFWLIVVFVVLFALRLYNFHQLKRRRAEQRARETARRLPEPMVRCSRCGVFLPKSDARALAHGGYACPAECQPPTRH